jgi:TetR/AcrR family transcriptional regulator, transcriptional repressor for nem operon
VTKGEQTRKRIVEAAAPIFNRLGYDGSSLADLMAATGLKKGGIYRHFASKEELAAAAFDYAWDSVWKSRMRDVDEKTRGIENLKQRIGNFVERRSPVPGGCPVLNTAVTATEGNAVLRARVAKALRTWRESLEAEVASAAGRGEVRPDVDARTVAMMIIATLEGALMISRLERSPQALLRAKEHLNRYLDTEVALPPSADPRKG